MTDKDAMAMALKALQKARYRSLVDEIVDPAITALKARLAQRTEQNFCPRCGKRTNDIHTCTPPKENT